MEGAENVLFSQVKRREESACNFNDPYGQTVEDIDLKLVIFYLVT